MLFVSIYTALIDEHGSHERQCMSRTTRTYQTHRLADLLSAAIVLSLRFRFASTALFLRNRRKSRIDMLSAACPAGLTTSHAYDLTAHGCVRAQAGDVAETSKSVHSQVSSIRLGTC